MTLVHGNGGSVTKYDALDAAKRITTANLRDEELRRVFKSAVHGSALPAAAEAASVLSVPQERDDYLIYTVCVSIVHSEIAFAKQVLEFVSQASRDQALTVFSRQTATSMHERMIQGDECKEP